MGITEYATRTTPDIVQKSVHSFFHKEELFKRMLERGKVKRSGGTKVQIPRIKSKHSNIQPVDAANLVIEPAKFETLSQLEGDWGWLAKPIMIPHPDKTRLQTPEAVKNHIQDMVTAAMDGFRMDFYKQAYGGGVTELDRVGTFNGTVSGLASSGFERGAFEPDTPANQSSTGNSYLGEARTQDTTDDANNWYNQYAAHDGILGNALTKIEEVKALADSYASDGQVEVGIGSIANCVALAEAVRTYGAGVGGNGNAALAAGVVYTAQDVAAGKVNLPITKIAGVEFHGSRFMSDSDWSADNEVFYLCNPNTIEFWVNEDMYFKTTPFEDMSRFGKMYDLAFIHLQVQLVVRELLANGLITQAS